MKYFVNLEYKIYSKSKINVVWCYFFIEEDIKINGGTGTAVFSAREQRCIATGQWKVRGNAAAACMSRSALGSARWRSVTPRTIHHYQLWRFQAVLRSSWTTRLIGPGHMFCWKLCKNKFVFSCVDMFQD